MLDVSLESISFHHRRGFSLEGLSLRFPRGTSTALIGAAGAGKTTILELISGIHRPSSGIVRIGSREVQGLAMSRRPLLFRRGDDSLPWWWSVRHVMVAALHSRDLDREDRLEELEHLTNEWDLRHIADRRTSTLSTAERTRVHLARMIAFRPAIVVCERLLEGAAASERRSIAESFYGAMRLQGSTVISEPASLSETGFLDHVVVVHEGRIECQGTPSQLFRQPTSSVEAEATGDVNIIPVTVRGGIVTSAIGSWTVVSSAVEGDAVAIARPSDFAIPSGDEESEFILSVDQAFFFEGHWHVRGLVTGGLMLKVELPGSSTIHKGRLIPLRYDPSRFMLISRAHPPVIGIPTDVVPPSGESDPRQD